MDFNIKQIRNLLRKMIKMPICDWYDDQKVG